MACSTHPRPGRPVHPYGKPRHHMPWMVWATLLGVALLVPLACAPATTPFHQEPGITKIKHIIIIMQENRSFDSYFGTYPGADGIPMLDGAPSVCVNDPATGQCIRPFHDTQDQNFGGPHFAGAATADINGGQMNGYIESAENGKRADCQIDPNAPACILGNGLDVMGYHTGADIPNYWSYAGNYVLQDHMYEPNASWSLPAHLFMVSAWSAKCGKPGDPMSCVNALDGPSDTDTRRNDYAWTDLTYLLHQHHVSWAYYLSNGDEPDCENDAMICPPTTQNVVVPGIWNPLPAFDTVKQDRQLGNIQETASFLAAARNGTLPAVSWVVPDAAVSEHPPNLVSAGQAYVTSLVNAVMSGPDWSSSAIFVSWDDWGGFYDHVVPPNVDKNGYGLRVPGLVISPYAKRGYIDHQTLSFDAYLKFIEDDFLGGARLDPATDGRPDPRPDVRENAAILGNLVSDFDFTQPPRPPMLLPPNPATDLVPPASTATPTATPAA